ncbi:hypothetical protein J6Q66_06175 [bacterium]|nr:hypothetical protein [bacterium]
MILKSFSDFLKENESLSATKALFVWLCSRRTNNPIENVDKIINKELYFALNKRKDVMVIAKSESGRTLMNALYNFALSYEQYKLAKWLHERKSTDFNNK